jgi:para-nitrobenzyl esterase
MTRRNADPIDRLRRRLLGAASLGAVAMAPLARAAGPSRLPSSPALRTTAGRLRGFVDKDLLVFRGIRYGADTAPRRFMPPAAPQAWRGVVETREFGAASPQPGSEKNQSEDCLFLNVTTPLARPARPRPVIVYIHGGAY